MNYADLWSIDQHGPVTFHRSDQRCDHRVPVPTETVNEAANIVIGDWARRYAPVFGLEVNVDELVQSVTGAYGGALR